MLRPLHFVMLRSAVALYMLDKQQMTDRAACLVCLLGTLLRTPVRIRCVLFRASLLNALFTPVFGAGQLLDLPSYRVRLQPLS